MCIVRQKCVVMQYRGACTPSKGSISLVKMDNQTAKGEDLLNAELTAILGLKTRGTPRELLSAQWG